MTVLARVECYAGYKADERPIAFWLGDRRYQVLDVVDRWYGPDGTWFKLRADDGSTYILCHRERAPGGAWTLEAYRRERKPGRAGPRNPR